MEVGTNIFKFYEPLPHLGDGLHVTHSKLNYLKMLSVFCKNKNKNCRVSTSLCLNFNLPPFIYLFYDRITYEENVILI